MTVGVDSRCGLKAGVAREPHHPIATLVHAAIFGGQGRVLYPLLKTADAFIVALGDLGLDAPQRSVDEERLGRSGHGW
jgi:hypothetical protein